jgi:hypothetical protein
MRVPDSVQEITFVFTSIKYVSNNINEMVKRKAIKRLEANEKKKFKTR